ncbi:hypothetical protein EV121DRAFT_255912 [Schizophyllum commune]
MPSAARSILFALAVLGLAGRYDSSGTTSMVMAAPIAQPSFPVADYSHNVGPASTPGKSMRVKHHESSELSRYASSRSAAAQATSAASGSSLQPRADQFALLNDRYHSARKNAATYKRLSAQSYSPSAAQDADFQQKCATALNDFQLDVLGIKEILQTAGADRGLAFYDRTNDVQTLMKNVVNLHKDVLKATTILVDNIPVLGPILGPIVYQIKCLLELTLDAIENLTDALINALDPLMRSLLPMFVGAPDCPNGISVLGVCM